MEKILSFSGGKDSTALLLKLIEGGGQIDEVIWVDLGMEFPEMYEHIEQVQKVHPITVLKPDKTFQELLFKYGVPTQRVRWCTKELKIRTIQKYLKGRDYKVYMGFALGEEKRKNRFPQDKYLFPLIDDFKMTEKDCLEFCYQKGFNWSGLYKKMDRLSCWCCPLQKISDFKVLYKDYPEKWQKLKEWEEKLNQSWLIKENTKTLEVRYELEEELGFPISKFKVHQDMLKKRLKEKGLL